MPRAKKESAEKDRGEVIHLRIPKALAARIEAIRETYQRGAPDGIEITTGEAIRAMLTSAAATHEREIDHKAKLAEQQARATQRADHGQEAGA